MIIKKELIDASINAKNAAKEAKDKAIAESVLGLVEKMKELPPIIKDIMDTFFYVKKSDDSLGSLMWRAMCSEDEGFGLDFCNAIREEAGDRCGVRPHWSRKECFSDLYVTSSGVYFGERYDELYPIDELKDRLRAESYEPMLKAMCLMIEAVPAYRDKVASVLNGLLEKGGDEKAQSNGLVMPKE
jgi:hypothetical protein